MVKSTFSNGASPLRRRLRTSVAFLGLAWFAAATLAAGPAFDQAEYAARRQKLMTAIPDGVAVVFGAQTLPGYTSFFQGNDFMYLCGVEVPNAILIVDGIRKSSTLFFTISESDARTEGISPAFLKDPKKESGLEAVLPVERFDATLAGLAARTKVLHFLARQEQGEWPIHFGRISDSSARSSDRRQPGRLNNAILTSARGRNTLLVVMGRRNSELGVGRFRAAKKSKFLSTSSSYGEQRDFALKRRI